MRHLSNFWDNLADRVRICLCCHSKSAKNKLLCRSCDLSLIGARRRNWVHFENSVPTLALYNWREQNHVVFKKYAQCLKGGRTKNIFADLAHEITQLRVGLYPSLNNFDQVLFVPAPGTSRFARDHAEELAFQLSVIWRGIYKPCLVRVSKVKQKRQNLESRGRGQKFILRESIPLGKNVKCIFIDDVYTSGSTARAAYKILGRPENFENWALFYRPRLRASRG